MNEFEITLLNNYTIFFLIVMSLFTLVAPRRFSFLPILVSACFITMDQKLIIFNLNITTIRVLLFVGWLRVVIKEETDYIKLNSLDKIILLWSAFIIVSGVLLEGTSGAFINRVGLACNSVGVYFLFRVMMYDLLDVEMVIKFLSVLIVPLAIMMFIEYETGRNLFSFFGGVSEFTYIREGHMRCQGSFLHPILAGTFGATLAPLFIGLWFQGDRGKIFALTGVISATIIMLTSNSSGPLMAFVTGILWFMMWPMRYHMKSILWSIIGLFFTLHLIMKAPVWYLMGRISSITGGTGWHRGDLIDAAISHFNEWWLIGTNYTKHWLLNDTLADPNMVDITNQYIFEGVNGGIFRLILFVMIISTCFRIIWVIVNENPEETSVEKIIVWGMAGALMSHVVSFLSVSYFDQSAIYWYLLLALISTISLDHERLYPLQHEEATDD